MAKKNSGIWITGALGMLGSDLVEEVKAAGIPYMATGREVDITDKDAVMKFATQHRPALIINAAAYTAVDQAESEPDLAMAVNGHGPGNIGAAAAQIGAFVVHFSTDYVFDGSGERPWVETDHTAPLSVYGRSKLLGEQLLASATDRYLVFRISWLYGAKGKNFVQTVLRLLREKDELRIVADQIGSPTWTRPLAKQIIGLAKQHINRTSNTSQNFAQNITPTSSFSETSGNLPCGIFHYSDGGYISWYDFALAISEEALTAGLITKKIPIVPITTEEYPRPARRPRNSRFCHDKVKRELGFVIYPWRKNLAEFIRSTKL